MSVNDDICRASFSAWSCHGDPKHSIGNRKQAEHGEQRLKEVTITLFAAVGHGSGCMHGGWQMKDVPIHVSVGPKRQWRATPKRAWLCEEFPCSGYQRIIYKTLLCYNSHFIYQSGRIAWLMMFRPLCWHWIAGRIEGYAGWALNRWCVSTFSSLFPSFDARFCEDKL